MINVGPFLFDCLLHLPPLKANTLDTADKPINKPKTNKQKTNTKKTCLALKIFLETMYK